MAEMGLRLLLAVVLVAAAAAKLARPRESRDALVAFGFAGPAFRTVAWASLIAIELALAAGLVVGSDGAAWLGAAFMALLAAVLVGAIFRGRAGEPCGCFGARSRVGWPAVARNAVLAAGFAAVAVLPERSLSTDEWLGLGLIAALSTCAALAAAVAALARELGLLRLRVGSAAALEIPSEGPELGSRTELVEAIAQGPQHELALAVFTSRACRVCESLRPAIDSVAAHPALGVRVFDEHVDAAAWAALDIPGSPYAVALDRNGTVLAKGTFNNLAQLESVLATAERRREGATLGAA